MENKSTLSEMLKKFRSELSSYYPDDEIRSIFYLVTEHLLNYSKIDIHLKSSESISSQVHDKYGAILDRLRNWEPVQYITGTTEFYGLTFSVDRRVLIPRPETELLVRWIIEKESGKPGHFIEFGTGSGCMAVALAKHLKEASISACDISEHALEVAKRNADLNEVQVGLFRFDVLDGKAVLPFRYRVMLSNPPYVRESEKHFMQRNVLDYEPEIALFVSDSDALVYYRSIALLGRKYLYDGGSIYFEINENLHREVVKLLENTGFYGVEVREDLNGKARMMRGVK
jgi:release factor glutamine methyltransferase